MKRLTVNTSNPYDIFIERNILKSCGTIIKSISTSKNICLVTDSNVVSLYAKDLYFNLSSCGFNVTIFTLEAGEKSKNLYTIEKLYFHLVENKFSRADLIVAIGGGVVGDIAGFAAATYMRGINFIQVPTTLLAQVDSSIGGKTGVNIKTGKNLVGAFWQPKAVIVDPDLLSTLPKTYFEDGMAEVIKYGCIKDKDLFYRLFTNNIKDIMDEIIFNCINIKREIVQADENDNGERMVLNFGHTIGHAIEKLSNFKISHGNAVAIGMAIITRSSEKNGITKNGCYNSIIDLLNRFNLCIDTDISIENMIQTIVMDKKSSSTYINLILIKEIGQGFIFKANHERLTDFLLGEIK